MRAQANEMSLESTFVWVAVAFAASVGTWALVSGLPAAQTIALSTWPFAT